MSGYLIKTDLGQYYAASFQVEIGAINEVMRVSDANVADVIKNLNQAMVNNLGMQPNQVKEITWEYANGVILSS